MPKYGNTVIPSFYGPKHTIKRYDGDAFGFTSLKIGEVQEIIYPEDKNSLSKKFIEYTVYVQQVHNKVYNGVLYKHCVLINHLAGMADKVSWTLRKSDSAAKSDAFGLGSKVVILCINGSLSNPVIIGGLRDSKDNEKDTKDLGHNFHFVFNGIDAVINKDGELILQYLGKTDDDGTVNDDVDSDAVGTTLTLQKNGNFEVFTKDENQSYTIDHENKEIITKADSKWEVDVGNGKSIIKSQGLEVGDASDNFLLGSTYRNAEQELHNKVTAALNVIQNLTTAIATSLTTAGSSMLTPIVGAVAAAPQITAAATALNLVVGQIANLSSAIQSFEGQAQKYLSTKNKSD